MAGNILAALRVSLSADTAAFSTGMSKAKREAAQSSSAIQKSLGGVKTAMAGITAGLVVGAFMVAARNALQYAASLTELAQQVGVTVEQYQALGRAAILSGSSQEKLDAGLKRLNITLGEAKNGSKAAIQAFTQIGISREQIASFRDAGDALPYVMEGLKNIGTTAERAAAGKRLVSRSIGDLLPMLSQGAAGYREMMEVATKEGVITAEMASRADDAADKMERLGMVARTQLASGLLSAMPAIEDMVGGLAKLGSKVLDVMGAIRRAGQRARLRYELSIARNEESPLRTRLGALRNARAVVANMAAEQGGGKPKPKPEPDIEVGATNLDFSGGGGGGKGKSAEQLAAEAERQRLQALRQSFDLARDEIDGQGQILSAQQALATDYAERADIARQLVDMDRQLAEKQIALDLDSGEINSAVAESRKKRAEQLALLAIQKINLEAQVDGERNFEETERAMFDKARGRLDSEARLAETAAERREIELRILDLAYREEKERLQRIIQQSTDEDEQNRARISLEGLEARRGLDRRGVMRGTMGPLESFLDSLPSSAAKANEALEMVAANGLQSVVDGLTDAMTGVRSLGDVFSNIARQIIADLIRIQIQKAISGGLSSVLGSIGSIFGSATAAAGASGSRGSFSRPKFATGGSFTVLGSKGVDTNLLSLNGVGIANVSHGERVSVAPANDNPRGGTFNFDLRGAVMTQELLAQMNAMADGAAVRGAMAGATIGEQRMVRRGRRRLA